MFEHSNILSGLDSGLQPIGKGASLLADEYKKQSPCTCRPPRTTLSTSELRLVKICKPSSRGCKPYIELAPHKKRRLQLKKTSSSHTATSAQVLHVILPL